MYLDFEDHRPEIPRVARAISAREGVILSIFAHALMLVLVMWVAQLPDRPRDATPIVPSRNELRYVYMAPRVDRVAPPRLTAESSDLDRRSATKERAPVPDNPLPFSRGNTPEKVEGAREERAAGPETPTPTPPAPTPTPPADPTRGTSPGALILPRQAASSGSLGESLRNLRQYLEDQNFDNQRGGQADPSADIQFDSKGADFGPWLRRFRNQVMRNWLIPLPAMAQSGRVVIQFYVLRNGTILDLKIVDASPVDAFNIAAFNALKMSNPTMVLPPDYPADRAFFTVTFHYNEGQDR